MRRVPGFPGLYREELGKEGTRYRIVISRNRKKLQEYFYFGDKTTEADARAKAVRRWKEIRDSLPVITRAAFAQIERRKSRSGIVGVRRITSEVKGHPYDFWIAVFSDRRRNKKMRSFSVNKYGEDKAKELALKARRDGLAQMEA
jgi:AP2 domain